jgi:UDP-4-amino-4,6-dideoxy-N-acetyl-beta-L-altrosamine transaminase
MEFIPYSCQNIVQDDIDAVAEALRSEFLTQGPCVPAFEEAFRRQHPAKHAVAVSNATAGLHLALLALGVGPGSRVWTSPNSFVSSANSVLFCGADIDFVDIDPVTRNMSLGELRAKLELMETLGKLPQVVMPVHFSGLPCDLREIRDLAQEYNFKILEDASHATGASYLGDPIACQFSDAAVFSFHAVKIITTAEGGMVATNDADIAGRLRQLRTHGITRSVDEMERIPEGPWYYEQHSLGFNYRLTDLQAALGVSQLRRIEELRRRRSILVDRYQESLADLPLILPKRLPDRQSAWHLYAVEIDEARTDRLRSDIFNHMRSVNIGVNVHYIPIHTQPFYLRRGFKVGDFPASEHYYRRALSIPLFPAMEEGQQLRVIAELNNAFRA